MRRVTMLEEMFRDVATRQERLTLDELYAKGAKGSAIVYMIKRIRKQWEIFVGKSDIVSPQDAPRTIKITEYGQTRLEALAN